MSLKIDIKSIFSRISIFKGQRTRLGFYLTNFVCFFKNNTHKGELSQLQRLGKVWGYNYNGWEKTLTTTIGKSWEE